MKAPKLVLVDNPSKDSCTSCLFIKNNGLCGVMGISPFYCEDNKMFVLRYTPEQLKEQLKEMTQTEKISDLPEKIYQLFEEMR
jgi:hypothetical protein